MLYKILSSSRAEEPANFLAAPDPDFFSKRLRLMFFSVGSGSGSKEPITPGSDRLRLPSSALAAGHLYVKKHYNYVFKYVPAFNTLIYTGYGRFIPGCIEHNKGCVNLLKLPVERRVLNKKAN